MKDILNQLIEHKSLDRETARDVLRRLAQGEFNASQMAAFLTVFLMRSITVDELLGFREAMLELCMPVNLQEFDPIDLCGTGGDGKDTFNISTLASFVVAGAGQPVAKHGNNGVSSVCGSSNVLAHFGYEFTRDVDRLKRSLEEANICFLHAPLFHPAMKNVAPIRRELGVKTFFNMLGPMVNPAFPKKQLVGVFSLELARLYHYLYQQSNTQYAIVHALDGYDEISLTGDFKIFSNKEERLMQPKELGFQQVDAEAIQGGSSITASAKIFEQLLKGDGTAAQEAVVLANAGLALKVAKGISMQDGVAQAREALRSGKAWEAFRSLIGDKYKTKVAVN